MPYNGSPRVGRQNNCSCCKACSECEKSDFCPLEKIDNQANQLRNLNNALERKNKEISKLRVVVIMTFIVLALLIYEEAWLVSRNMWISAIFIPMLGKILKNPTGQSQQGLIRKRQRSSNVG